MIGNDVVRLRKLMDLENVRNKECIEHLPDTNYWHYCLQLNTYKHLIEKNYGKKVKEMYLVCLHPNNQNKNFQRIKVCDLSQEVNDLLQLRKDDLNK